MSPERRRLVLAGVLAALVAIGGWWYFVPTASPTATAAAARPSPARGFSAPPVVQLAVLSTARARPSNGGRNPFVFGARDVVVGAPAVRKPTKEAPAVFTPPPALVPAGPPPPPPIPLKFIGLVEGTGGRKIAVLSDSKGFVAHGTEGAIIDGRYRILSIGTDTLELAYADGRGRQTLKLSGQ